MENIHFLTKNFNFIYFSKYFKLLQNKYVYLYKRNSYNIKLLNKEELNHILIKLKKNNQIYNKNQLLYYYLFIKEIIISYLKKYLLINIYDISKKTIIFYIIDNIGIKDNLKNLFK